MATITPAQGELQIRTLQRSPLSRVRGHLGGLWGRPITQAIAKALLTIYVTSTITFGLIRLMPGSPVEIKIDELMHGSAMSYADAAAQASALFDLNLNAPIHEHYFEYLGRYLDVPVRRVLSILPTKYDDLWTGAKGFYKVEPIVADGGQVVIYAPHIREISTTHPHIAEIGEPSRALRWSRVAGVGRYSARCRNRTRGFKRRCAHRW